MAWDKGTAPEPALKASSQGLGGKGVTREVGEPEEFNVPEAYGRMSQEERTIQLCWMETDGRGRGSPGTGDTVAFRLWQELLVRMVGMEELVRREAERRGMGFKEVVC